MDRNQADQTVESPAKERNASGEAPHRGDFGGAYRYPGPPQPQFGFWSKKCVRQRSSSLSPWNHTPDCDNPAYTGGYHGRPYPPAYGYAPPVIIINAPPRFPRH